MLLFFVCAAFALFPKEVLFGAQNGLAMCINAVIPSLLPFMVVSSCVIKSNFARPLGALFSKVLTPLTGISGSGSVCFITGLVGGYGAGAKAVYECYSRGLISKKEAESLLVFSNNPGPLFIIGTVGIGFYLSRTIGVTLLLVQIITSVITARVFSGNFNQSVSVKKEWDYYKKNKPPLGMLVTKSAIESGSAIVTACVFVILFCALTEVLPLGEYSFLGGILEVTRGCSEMSQKGTEALSLTSAFLSWGGLSVHLQANALCKGELSLKKYYIGKAFSAAISYLITYICAGDMNILLIVIILCGIFLILYGCVKYLFSPKSSPQLLFRQRRHS